MRNRTTHRPGRPDALRPLAIAVVLLSVWAHLSSLAHMVLVRHVACPEHGELVHAGEGGHVHPAARHVGASLDGGGESAPGEHHDHCAIAAHRRQQVAHAPASAALAAWTGARPPPVLVGIALPERDVRPAALAVYRLAPKTSPPA